MDKVLSDDSLEVTHLITGDRVRLDICPEDHMEKYEPKAGYVFCRFVYTNQGCIDIAPSRGNKFTWVKDKYGWTTTVGPDDTFQPWPVCRKDDTQIQGGQ